MIETFKRELPFRQMTKLPFGMYKLMGLSSVNLEETREPRLHNRANNQHKSAEVSGACASDLRPDGNITPL
jgi:hypothetical protein